MQDFYKILGVNENADEKEIKKAYKVLAKKWHPDGFAAQGEDKICEAEAKMKDINAAYDVLKDKAKREEYDLSRKNPFYGSKIKNDSYEEMLRQMFRDKMNRTKPNVRGSDVNIDIVINLEDVLHGLDKIINFYHMVNCNVCHGSGSKDEFQVKCKRCHGLGFDFVNMNQTCPQCHGKGKIPLIACEKCNGTGKIKIKDTVTLHIPKGIKDGMRLRVSNKGDIGLNQQYGDLFITIHINKHPIFTREDNNLLINLDIYYIDAILGCNKIVQTLDGYTDICIPKYSQPNDIITIKGKGLPQMRNNIYGDLKCKLNIILPKELNNEQIELLEKLR